MNPRRTLLLALALAGLLAAACATLRVDVDVYTGALADHEDIQAERMAVMAIGAKPLLIELRDRLENLERMQLIARGDQSAAPGAQGQRKPFTPENESYTAGFVVPSTSPADYIDWRTLIDDQSRRVNAVLGLYEDVANPNLAQYIKDSMRYYADYEQSVATLSDDQAEAMKDKLLNLASTFADPTDKSLCNAYALFFQKKLCIYEIFYTNKLGNTPCSPSRAQTLNPPGEHSTPLFIYLRDNKEPLQRNSNTIFKKSPGSEEKNTFIRLAQERASAFINKRSAIEKLFTTHLALLNYISHEPIRSSIKNYDKIKEVAVHMVVSLLKAGYLADIKRCCTNNKLDLACRNLVYLLDNIGDGETFKSIKEKIRIKLLNFPKETSEQLLAAHDMVKRGYCEAINSDPVATQFGITLFAEEDALPTPAELLAALNNMSQLAATSGLEHGRGPEGLETIIDRYIEASQAFCKARGGRCGQGDCSAGDAACTAAKARLDVSRDLMREELVRFAEKVLVIANNEVMLTQYAGDTNDPSAKIVDNIQVLQAVANSILNQANELVLRQDHRDALASRLDGLKNTLVETYTLSGRRVLALVVEQLAAERAVLAARQAQEQTEADDKAAMLKTAEAEQKAKEAEVKKLEDSSKALAPARVFKNALAACLTQSNSANSTLGLAQAEPRNVNFLKDKPATAAGDWSNNLTKTGAYLDTAAAQLKDLNDKASALREARSNLLTASPPGDESADVRASFSAAKDIAQNLSTDNVGASYSTVVQIQGEFAKAKACFDQYAAGGQATLGKDKCAGYADGPALAAACKGLVGKPAQDALQAVLDAFRAPVANLDKDAAALATRLSGLDKDQKKAQQAAQDAAAKVAQIKKQADAAAAKPALGQATLADLDTAIKTVDAIRATWLEIPPDAPAGDRKTGGAAGQKTAQAKKKTTLAATNSTLVQVNLTLVQGESAVQGNATLVARSSLPAVKQEPTPPKDQSSGGNPPAEQTPIVPVDPAKRESPVEVVSRLLALLSAGKDKAGYATTYNVVAARSFSFPTLGALSRQVDARKDPRLALDQLLDALYLVLSQEVKAGGMSSDSAAHTRQAIEVVEAQRSGLIYLRPASAYLGSSYPATSIQPGLESPGWKNTLTRNFFRSLPLVGGTITDSEKRRREVFAEIDRQSWRTVNTVRLEGGGRTNYAIAKDDIGNWYAKAYSADPEDIIKGARSLAMFSMGMPSGVVPAATAKTAAAAKDTLQTLEQSGAGGAPANPTPAKPQTALEQLHASHAAQYDKETGEQAKKLLASLKDGTAKNLVSSTLSSGAYKDIDTEAKTELEAAATATDIAAAAGKLDSDASLTPSQRILAGLKLLKQFATDLDARLKAKGLALTEDTNKTKKAQYESARAAARRIFTAEINNRLEQHLATVDAYLNAVTFLGKAASAGTASSPGEAKK